MLAIFMVNIGNVSTDRLVHELQHDYQVEHVVAAQHHEFQAGSDDIYYADADAGKSADEKSIAKERLHTSEHQLFHALNHLQFFPDLFQLNVLLSPEPSLAPLRWEVQLPPFSSFDPPLRPPCATFT